MKTVKHQILLSFFKYKGKRKPRTEISLYDGDVDINDIIYEHEQDYAGNKNISFHKIYQAPSCVLNSISTKNSTSEDYTSTGEYLNTEKIINYIYDNYKPTKRDKTKIFSTKTVIEYD